LENSRTIYPKEITLKAPTEFLQLPVVANLMETIIQLGMKKKNMKAH